MKEIEIDCEDGYFVGPSPIGRNTNMSLRAKGLMYVFFTLPPNWDYSLNGLISICQEGRDVIKNTLNELKRFGYVEINRVRDEKGQFRYKYIVHRKSVLEEKLKDNSPLTEYPSTDSPMTVDQLQLKDLTIKDKIVNHYLARYILIPKLDKYLDNRIIATRTNMGSSYGIKLIKKYLEKYKKYDPKFQVGAEVINFTSSELLIASIGVIFDAFFAEFLQDSHIVTTDTIILTTIAVHDIPYVNKVPLDT